MPKYYCDYCDVFLTHDSPSVRKSHNEGWKHKAAVRTYYSQFEEDTTQMLIDMKVKEFEARQAMGGVMGGAMGRALPFPPQIMAAMMAAAGAGMPFRPGMTPGMPGMPGMPVPPPGMPPPGMFGFPPPNPANNPPPTSAPTPTTNN